MISQKHDETDESQTSSHGSSASRATGGSVTISGNIIVAVIAAFCGMAVAVSIWAAFEARDAATEARMAEYYLLQLDGHMMAAGIIKPDESVASKLNERLPSNSQ